MEKVLVEEKNSKRKLDVKIGSGISLRKDLSNPATQCGS